MTNKNTDWPKVEQNIARHEQNIHNIQSGAVLPEGEGNPIAMREHKRVSNAYAERLTSIATLKKGNKKSADDGELEKQIALFHNAIQNTRNILDIFLQLKKKEVSSDAEESKKTRELQNVSQLLEDLYRQEEDAATQLEEMLEKRNKIGSEEKALISLRYKNLAEALRLKKIFDTELANIADEQARLGELLAKHRNNPALIERVQQNHQLMNALKQEREELYDMSPEAFIGLHLKELQNYTKAIESGRMVVTPYVESVKNDINAHLDIHKPVFISGHFGSGKTELAINIAIERTGEPPIVISGSENTSLAELYGCTVLKVSNDQIADLKEYNREVELAFAEWQEENEPKLQNMPEAQRESEISRAHERFLHLYVAKTTNATITDFLLGKVYEAMEKGRVLILDEVNAIPHEILISLNYLLTRKPGDVIDIQQHAGKRIVVAEGFGVIATGNLNKPLLDEVYVGRKKLDLAFRNRFYEKEYDYLPQSTSGTLEEVNEQDEQFHLLVASLADKKGALSLPEGSIRKLYNLAKCARRLQDVFSGKAQGNMLIAGADTPYALQEATPSFRDLLGIMQVWQGGGFKHELDHYVLQEFVNRASFPDSDKAYVYSIFRTYGDFFTGAGWPTVAELNYEDLSMAFAISSPDNAEKKVEVFTPRQTVEICFGKPPERTVFPKLNSEKESPEEEDLDIALLEQQEQKIAEYKEFLTDQQAFLAARSVTS